MRRSAPWPKRLSRSVRAGGNGRVFAVHDMLPQPAMMIVVIVILHAHHRDAELHTGKDDPVGHPQDQHRERAVAAMRDEVPQIRDIEPQQQRDEHARDAESDGDLRDIEPDELGHGRPPLLIPSTYVVANGLQGTAPATAGGGDKLPGRTAPHGFFARPKSGASTSCPASMMPRRMARVR